MCPEQEIALQQVQTAVRASLLLSQSYDSADIIILEITVVEEDTVWNLRLTSVVEAQC